ncbi:ArsR/SmtB family transcription factor [Thiobacter aerophilum]|uniref:Helix-turn-helix transcriptional regulator n=1 Tax=Thiobacter aerophilum TaxID=3121275 RepID=A0ABV0EAS5_9BURK
MDNQAAVELLESLASGPRLSVYRLLVKHGSAGLVAGEIAGTLGLAPSNLSFHLKALAQAGLVTPVQEGRFMRYRANIPLMLELIAYLTEECCAHQPGECASLRAASPCSEAVLPPLKTKPGVKA